MSNYQGEGWYTFEPYTDEGPLWSGTAEAVWVENEDYFEDYCEVPDGCECVATYHGSDDLPDDEDVRVDERFVASFTAEQAAAYAERLS